MPTRLVSPVLVGRQSEMERFRSAYARACDGEPTVVVVAGEAGVGKSRLVRDATAWATHQGARVLTGGCVELGGEEVPFVPVVEALRALVRNTSESELDELLGPARRDLARLLPELHPEAAREATTDPGATGRLFELILGLVSRLAAGQPLVLSIEDIHWADRSTLDLLAFLTRALRTDRVLVVATYRAEDVHRQHPLRRLLAEVERLPNVERLELVPFTRAEVVVQLREILGEQPAADLVDSVFERSEGNAFFVEELAASRGAEAAGRLRPALRDVLLNRVEALAPQTRGLLHAVSAAGQRVGHRLLAQVVGVTEDELDSALQDAVDHQVLAVEEGHAGYTFRHALVREAVYDQVLPGQRTRLHIAYAEALEADPTLAEGGATPAAMLAYHWSAAHDLARALTASVEAGRQAATAYGFAEAARHLERALEVWPRVPEPESQAGLDLIDLLDLASTARAREASVERALSLLDEALSLVDRQREPVRAALLLTKRGRLLRDRVQDEAFDDLNEAAALLPADAPERASVLASIAATGLVLSDFDFAVVREVAAEAVEAARAVGDDRSLADALATLGTALVYTGSREEGTGLLRDAVALAESGEDERVTLRALINLSDALGALGQMQEAADVARRGLVLAQQVGLSRMEGIFVAANLADALMPLGEWDEAEAVLSEALTLATIGLPHEWLRTTDEQLALLRGDLGRASQHLNIELDHPDAQMRALQRGHRAELAVLEGRLLDARSQLAELLATTTPDNHYLWPSMWLAMRVEADLASQARDRRTELGEEHHQRVESIMEIARALPLDAPALRGYVRMTEAESTRAAGLPSVGAWDAAITAWRAAGDVYQVAYGQFRLAEAHAAQGDRTAATEPLAEAAAVARRLEARPLLADIESLASRARIDLGGAPAPPVGATSGHGLTAREVEVLRLVVEGRSNGEIAAGLYISAKTASVHVSNILRKLDVANRVEAAALAHRLRLLDA